jgi:16S rRNA (guanine527-N7)-methyltransferase
LVEALSQDQRDSLRRYEALLQTKAVPMGLVSRRDGGRIWERHILDSLRALVSMRRTDRLVADLGSGAGLPGIPIAIARPDARVLLIEARQRATAFLEFAVHHLALGNAEALMLNVSDAVLSVDLCLARAFASASGSWRAAEPLLAPGGALLYWAGRSSPDTWLAEAVGVRVEICAPASQVGGGPLVMMARDEGRSVAKDKGRSAANAVGRARVSRVQ